MASDRRLRPCASSYVRDLLTRLVCAAQTDAAPGGARARGPAVSAPTWPLFLAAAGAGAVGRYLLDQWVHERTHAPTGPRTGTPLRIRRLRRRRSNDAAPPLLAPPAPGRWATAAPVGAASRHRIPWGTFVVNVTGSLALGVVIGLGLYHDLGETALVVVGTGGLGAYTTFSAFSWEVAHLLEAGRPAVSARYVAATVAVGLAAAAAGLALTAAL